MTAELQVTKEQLIWAPRSCEKAWRQELRMGASARRASGRNQGSQERSCRVIRTAGTRSCWAFQSRGDGKSAV